MRGQMFYYSLGTCAHETRLLHTDVSGGKADELPAAPPLFSANHRTPQACRRYGGSFDWLAIGDDDTVFMYNRAVAFLKNINHSQVCILIE